MNPTRYQERRDAILDAAHREFAAAGFERTTTASICAAAGISSGTFFHYFPTKKAVLVGILAAGTASTDARIQRIATSSRGLAAIVEYVEDLEDEMADEHFAGFVHAVIGAAHLPEVADALREDAELVARFLRDRLSEAAADGEVRTDVPPDSLARWVGWLIDGSAQGVVDGAGVSGELGEAIRVLLRPTG